MSYYRSLIQSDLYLTNQIAFYPLNSNSNDTINGQNGTDVSISYSNVGKIGNCATFSGNPSLITLPDNDNFSFGTGAFSINLWIYPVGVSSYIISKRNTSNIEYQSTYTATTLTFIMYSGNSTLNFIGKIFTASLTLNNWNMVTFTFAGGTVPAGLKAYLNGNLIAVSANQTGSTYTSMTNTVAPVVLGRQGNVTTGNLNGRLDQLRIWKGRELTASEIANIYTTLY